MFSPMDDGPAAPSSPTSIPIAKERRRPRSTASESSMGWVDWSGLTSRLQVRFPEVRLFSVVEKMSVCTACVCRALVCAQHC